MDSGNMVLTRVLTFFVCILLSDCVNINETHQYQLHKHLFTSYNPMLRPRKDGNPLLKPVEELSDYEVQVTLEFELSTVTGLDEVNQVMYTVGFVVAEWYDDFLKWIPNNYGGIEHLVLPPNQVWLPDIAIKNSADKFYDPSFTRDFRVDIRFDGRVIWAFGGNFATSCTLDMTYYPFDLQKCDVIFENWAYTTDLVDLMNKAVERQDFSENGEWKLDHTTSSRTTFTEDTHKHKRFPRVVFSIYLSRKFRYYVINIILPAMFLITISLFVFWLPPDSGEKVSLGITVLLAFSVFQLVIMEHTPRTSDFTPVMTMLFTIIMGESTFSVLTSILVLYFHHHGAEMRPPKIVRHIAFHYLARLLLMQNQVPSEKQMIPDMQEEMTTVKRMSAVSPSSPCPSHNGTIAGSKQDGGGNKQQPSCGEVYLREMLFYVKGLSAKMHLKERDDVIMEEWKCLARVIDRTFFCIAFVVTVIIVPVLLVPSDAHDM